jgi:hypothetical protein
MTDSIPISDLPAPGDETRRDRWGRYLVVPPGGGKPVGYTRVTTIAKSLDNGGGLAPWKAAMSLCGAVKRRGLLAQFEALMAGTAGEPWYSGQQAKTEAKRLVEELAAAGGATERRDVGTSLHTLTALHDVGRTPEHLTAETERDLNAYVTTLEAAGITVMPGMVEACVVLDDFRVAGIFDRGLDVPGFDRPLVGDLKCGSDLSYSWPAISVQLSAYANADAIYRQGAAADGSEDERLPMVNFDRDNGVVIWVDAGTGECSLFLVDLATGWQGFELSVAARTWRKVNVSRPLAEGPFMRAPAEEEDLAELLRASTDTAADADGSDPDDPGKPGLVDDEQHTPEVGGPGPSPGAANDDHTPAVRAWLQERIDAIGKHRTARGDLLASWLPGLPTPGEARTTEQLDAIGALLDQVERRHKIPWPEPKPGVDLLATVLKIFPGTVEA